MSPTRREFLGAGLAAGAGLVIGFYLPHPSAQAAASGFAPNAYLKITPANEIVIMLARSEMGQGVRTALPMILAEELGADWKLIRVEQVGASTLYGDQTTGGSASVRSTWDPMRKAGAAAREMLITAAAMEWGVGRSLCKAQNGSVVHSASGRKLTYGELARRAGALPVPTDAPLKQPKDYTLVGTRVARLDTADKVQGKTQFGIDMRLPGMKYAVLARCPVFGGKLLGFDDSESKKSPGVSFVGKINDYSVAVVADSTWNAIEGRKALKVTWDEGPNKDLGSSGISQDYRRMATDKAASLYSAGDVSRAVGRRITGDYELPFMAHAPMEPGNSTAHYQNGRCEIWSPTQVPQDVRDSAAQALGIDPDQVKVNITFLGGGFGRRLEHDYGVEAAMVSKAAGVPVKVQWTREDDMQMSTYRPASYHVLNATLDGQGWPLAFTHRVVGPSINTQKGFGGEGDANPDLQDGAAVLYGIPNVSVESVMTKTPVPLGWMRAVWAVPCAFAAESFIDELAAAAGKDPLDYRMHLLSQDVDVKYWADTWHTSRLRGTLQLAAEKAGYGKSLPAGHYHGVACFASFSSYAAAVAEVSMEDNRPRVHRVVAAVDVGQVINPNILEQQIQGGVHFGLTNVLEAQITLAKGRVVQSNFNDYPPVRISQAPVVEAYFVQSTETPTGCGEPPIAPVAPAVCNAIFAATKKRVRSLPVIT